MASRCEKTSEVAATVTSTGAVRPRFRERQLLRAADLEAQQSYLIAARRRHNIGQHGWGIVQGLEIDDTSELVVQPGMAVDGYGRELIVTSPVTIPNNVFTELGDKALDVWLVYQVTDVNVPQRGSWGRGPGKNARTREQITMLRLTASPKNDKRLPTEVPREPVEVPDADLPFLPHRTPPDDPALEWPVYLGTINQGLPPVVDPNSPRPYATLTGELVTAPSGLACMQVGTELQSDPRRFAVTVADASGKLTERVGIDGEGNTYITGNTTVKHAVDKPVNNPDIDLNHLRLRRADLGPGGPGPAGLLNFRPLAAPPAAAAPWQIYRTSVKEGNATIRQLRFEILHPADKGDSTSYRFAIGTRDATTGLFSSCFSLSADCTLTIAGDLTIGGQIVEGPIQADPIDTRFGALVAEVWAAGTKVGEVTATTGTIGGIVTNTGGAVMSGVNVELSSDGALVTTVVTDAAGRYIASVLPIGDYTISATAPGFEPTTADATLAAFDVLNIPLVLSQTPPPAAIQGSVLDANGAVVPNATIVFTNTTTGAVQTVTTNAAGSFNSGPLPAGTYSVRVTAPGFIPQTVTAAAGDVLNIILQPPLASIQGDVVDTNNANVPGATVEFTHTISGTVKTVTADSSGIFTSGPLTPGTYSVRVTAAGFLPQTLTAEPGDELNFVLQTPPQPAAIQGSVLDANGAVVPGATVEFRDPNTGTIQTVTTTSDEGFFSSGPLTPGTYEVRVNAAGFVIQIVTATQGQILTITLEPSIPIPP